MKIALTICSYEKDDAHGLLPANQRYTHPRINKVNKIAKRNKLPFYILSGKFGLLKESTLIPWYDKLLKKEEITELVQVLIDQLINEKIEEIEFYGEAKSSSGWEAYHELLKLACEKLNIKLIKSQI